MLVFSSRPPSFFRCVRMNRTLGYSLGCQLLHGRQQKRNGRSELCRQSLKKSPTLISKRRGKSSEIKQRRRTMKVINGKMRQLKAEMEEISKDQESIRQGQKEVREKFEAIENECQQLRRETELMAQQSASTKLRLVLMFQILKARENGDFASATNLARILREMIARNNQT